MVNYIIRKYFSDVDKLYSTIAMKKTRDHKHIRHQHYDAKYVIKTITNIWYNALDYMNLWHIGNPVFFISRKENELKTKK